MRTGAIISGLGHGGVLVFAVYGSYWFASEPEPLALDGREIDTKIVTTAPVTSERTNAAANPQTPPGTTSEPETEILPQIEPDTQVTGLGIAETDVPRRFSSPVPARRPELPEPVETITPPTAEVTKPVEEVPAPDPQDGSIATAESTPVPSGRPVHDVPAANQTQPTETTATGNPAPVKQQPEPSSARAEETEETPAKVETADISVTAPLNLSERNGLRLGVNQHYRFADDRSDPAMTAVLQIRLDRAGKLLGTPELRQISGGTPAAQRAFLRSARRALLASAQNGVFEILPAKKYVRWKTLDFRFGIDGLGVSS
ncbi:MAG: hypothetical protein AAF557_26070 [Pseudomonadota bacterium]